MAKTLENSDMDILDTADAAADAAAAAATLAPHLTGVQQQHLAGRSLHRTPALGAGAGVARGWQEGVVKRL